MFMDSYNKLFANYFRSECDAVDFRENKDAIKIINCWCSEKTNEKIEYLTNAETSIILSNEIYFKSIWKYQFPKEYTKPMLFHLDKYKSIQVPTMYCENYLLRGKLDMDGIDAEFVEIPYQVFKSVIFN